MMTVHDFLWVCVGFVVVMMAINVFFGPLD